MQRLFALFLIILSLPLSAYVSPTTGKDYASGITRGFDKPARNWLKGHRGVDLAAPMNAEIYASKDGVVSYSGVIAGTPVLAIEHDDGVKTTYQPVHSFVSQGQTVTEGQVIGKLSGTDGLHWGALIGKDDYINPLSLLRVPVMRLKPVDGLDRTPP